MIIGISTNYAEGTYRIAQEYADSLMKAGACTMMLPITEDTNVIEQYIDNIDALLLTGGGDMDPDFWGEEALEGSDLTPRFRDIYDLELYHAARRRCMPIMGICRGMQVMAIAEGGTLYQDIHKCFDINALNHSPKADKTLPYHSVKITHPFFEAMLPEVRKNSELGVNSLHHQSINVLPEIFSIGALAEDGVIEAFVAEHYPMFGVQWHPEHLQNTMPEHAALFSTFVKMAQQFAAAKKIHQSSHVIDSHTDSPMVWQDDTDMDKWQDDMKVDFQKMKSADMAATFMVAYLPQAEEQQKAYNQAVSTLNRLTQHANESPTVKLAKNADEIGKNKASGKQSVVLALENGHALNGNIDNIKFFHDMGVSYITLCHNGDNDLCDSAAGEKTHGGLSELGRKAIKLMNQYGIMVDISHASDDTMTQAIALSATPIIASHSGARAVCGHRRNVPDEILIELAKKGGVCQICLYEYFLNSDASKASIDDIIDHIRHIVNLVGIDHVGIGSDFDGGGGIKGCQSENEYTNITYKLIENGFSTDDIKKIMGENLLRVWREAKK